MDPTKYTHMFPEASVTKIRSVEIHTSEARIAGFMFLDKEGALLWKIGWTKGQSCNVEIVDIAENEVIVGVVGKLFQDRQSVYTDFQFQVAVRV